ncbi:tetratricopeptide repeat protein [Trinickia diaoshuihuensis]|jgi:Flp pilus assembly protein TadD|uniref:tetratricopeptide repeat protein n=1 Tax=Trinickia diaoshuihuensis TaxID=2292265 RepID=UPI000E241329|nr:hypothetical protein [Trinickia diaoshuihuensis]
MDTTFDALLEQAVAASREARWGDAQALLATAGEARPHAPEPHYLRAANFAATGDFPAAETEFLACLSRAPHLAIARFQFGLMYMTAGLADAARAIWEPLVATQHPLAAFARGMLAIAHGDRGQAEAWIRQGLSTHKDNAPLNADMTALLEKLVQLDVHGPLPEGPGSGTTQAPTGEPAVEDDASMHLLIASYTQR